MSCGGTTTSPLQISCWMGTVALHAPMSCATSMRVPTVGILRPSATIAGAMADPKSDFLRKVPLFEDLDDHILREIANAAVEQKWEAGQEIVRQGDTGVGMFVIRSGKVEICQDRDGQ